MADYSLVTWRRGRGRLFIDDLKEGAWPIIHWWLKGGAWQIIHWWLKKEAAWQIIHWWLKGKRMADYISLTLRKTYGRLYIGDWKEGAWQIICWWLKGGGLADYSLVTERRGHGRLFVGDSRRAVTDDYSLVTERRGWGIFIGIRTFSLRKCIPKCCLQNGHHFLQASLF